MAPTAMVPTAPPPGIGRPITIDSGMPSSRAPTAMATPLW